jgi:uncharacterized membrane protein
VPCGIPFEQKSVRDATPSVRLENDRLSGSADARSYRLTSIDVVRGLVIVIMALDHVRDYVMVAAEQDPTANPDIGAALFFTRWITHFCAPVFVFLAGTSAGLMAIRKTRQALGSFLLTRGLWLIAVEWFVISTAWTFAPRGIEQLGGLVLVAMGVIWAIGASMVVLAGAQFLGRRTCLVIGAAVVLGHNLLDPIWPASALLDPNAPWVALHGQMSYIVGPFHVAFVYPVLPWIGVMLLGFGAAGLFEAPRQERNRRLLEWGLALSAAFVLARAVGVYGDPNPWQVQASALKTTIDFLNTTKYPPSLLYLLMTLGPAAVLCAVADRLPGAVTRPLTVIGRVPFAFYVAHLYLIHVLSVALGVAQGFDARQLMTIQFFYPKGFGLSLPGVYGVWVLVVVLLYPFCAWVAAAKARRKDWWLSYV